MTAVGFEQQGSEAIGPGSSLCRVRYFYDFTDNCSHGTMGRTTGFRSARYGFESQPLPTFFNLIITTENRGTLLLCMKSIDTRNFPKHRRVPLQFLLAL